MSESEIKEIYDKGLAEVIEVIKGLYVEIKLLNSNVDALSERVKTLEDQKNKNSNNSSKPPSTDGFKKPNKSLREKSEKRPGGQKGHKGSTKNLSDTPDKIIIHQINECENCGEPIKDVEAKSYIRRQVIDIPEIKVEIVEHRAQIKECPCCGYINTAKFPEEVTSPVQYGEKIKAVAVYLTQYQLIPYKRSAELIEDIFNHPISEGSLASFNEKCHLKLETIENNIKNEIIAEKEAVHFDETGIYVNKKREWLHVASTRELTYYEHHANRGKKAIEDIGILPNFKGTAVHDGYRSYTSYECNHALCNAHILRDLNGISEMHQQEWSKEMKGLLLEIKKEVDLKKETGALMSQGEIESFENKYDEIIKGGIEEDYAQNIKLYTDDNKKRSPGLNLLNRLRKHKEQFLRFMYDFNVPFDNNQAERDLRMSKVKQKISGTFRSVEGARAFTRIRGYISTIRKHGKNAMDCLKSVFTKEPYDPTLII